MKMFILGFVTTLLFLVRETSQKPNKGYIKDNSIAMRPENVMLQLYIKTIQGAQRKLEGYSESDQEKTKRNTNPFHSVQSDASERKRHSGSFDDSTSRLRRQYPPYNYQDTNYEGQYNSGDPNSDPSDLTSYIYDPSSTNYLRRSQYFFPGSIYENPYDPSFNIYPGSAYSFRNTPYYSSAGADGSIPPQNGYSYDPQTASYSLPFPYNIYNNPYLTAPYPNVFFPKDLFAPYSYDFPPAEPNYPAYPSDYVPPPRYSAGYTGNPAAPPTYTDVSAYDQIILPSAPSTAENPPDFSPPVYVPISAYYPDDTRPSQYPNAPTAFSYSYRPPPYQYLGSSDAGANPPPQYKQKREAQKPEQQRIKRGIYSSTPTTPTTTNQVGPGWVKAEAPNSSSTSSTTPSTVTTPTMTTSSTTLSTANHWTTKPTSMTTTQTTTPPAGPIVKADMETTTAKATTAAATTKAATTAAPTTPSTSTTTTRTTTTIPPLVQSDIETTTAKATSAAATTTPTSTTTTQTTTTAKKADPPPIVKAGQDTTTVKLTTPAATTTPTSTTSTQTTKNLPPLVEAGENGSKESKGTTAAATTKAATTAAATTAAATTAAATTAAATTAAATTAAATTAAATTAAATTAAATISAATTSAAPAAAPPSINIDPGFYGGAYYNSRPYYVPPHQYYNNYPSHHHSNRKPLFNNKPDHSFYNGQTQNYFSETRDYGVLGPAAYDPRYSYQGQKTAPLVHSQSINYAHFLRPSDTNYNVDLAKEVLYHVPSSANYRGSQSYQKPYSIPEGYNRLYEEDIPDRLTPDSYETQYSGNQGGYENAYNGAQIQEPYEIKNKYDAPYDDGSEQFYQSPYSGSDRYRPPYQQEQNSQVPNKVQYSSQNVYSYNPASQYNSGQYYRPASSSQNVYNGYNPPENRYSNGYSETYDYGNSNFNREDNYYDLYGSYNSNSYGDARPSQSSGSYSDTPKQQYDSGTTYDNDKYNSKTSKKTKTYNYNNNNPQAQYSQSANYGYQQQGNRYR